MAAYAESITSISTLFCPIQSIGKTSMGFKTLFEQIKTVCAWSFLSISEKGHQQGVLMYGADFLADHR